MMIGAVRHIDYYQQICSLVTNIKKEQNVIRFSFILIPKKFICTVKITWRIPQLSLEKEDINVPHECIISDSNGQLSITNVSAP